MQLWSVLTLILCAVGLFGNSIVIAFSVIWRDLRKSTSSWYIFQMAMADTLYLMSLPFNVAQDESEMWIFPVWFCPLKNSLLYLNIYASVVFLSILSVDRYIAVCRPFSEVLQKFRSRRAMYIVTAVVWVVAACCCIPVLRNSFVFELFHICILQDFYNNSTNYEYYNFSSDYELHNYSDYADLITSDFEGDSYECSYKNEPIALKRMVIFNFAVMYAVPLAVMTICYGLLIHRLTRNGSSSQTASRSGRTSMRNRQITVMCAILVTSFAGMCLPFQMIHVGKLVGIPIESHHCTSWHNVGALLIILNSALNPYLYSFLCNKFRRRLRALVMKLANQQTPSGSRRTSKSSGCSGSSAVKMSMLRRKSHTSNRSKDSTSAPLGSDKVVEEEK